jgi:HSP20 family protein
MHRRRVSPMTDFGYLFDQMDRMAQEVLGGNPRVRVATLPVDVYDRGDELVIRAYVPGVHPEQIDIQIDDGVLTISGNFPELYDSEDAANWAWYTRELRAGSFQRSFNLPFKVDTEATTAKVEDGILWLTLPKAAEAKPHRISIAGSGSTVHELTASESES